MRKLVWIAFVAMGVCPAFGDDVPFAVPSAGRLGSPNEVYVASLADIMTIVQSRHMKLWHAAESRNWPLVSFEIKQLKDTFAKAAMFYDNVPIAYVMSIEWPLDKMQKASENKDLKEFSTGYVTLTAACNECHHAAGIGFVRIQTPTSTPFSDQKF